MDNQQRKTEIDLAWLGGFLDGEGCLHLRKQVGARLRAMGKVYYRPTLRICNTHEPTLQVVRRIFEANGFPCHVSHRDYDNINPSYKRAWDVEVSGIKRMARILPVLIPYLHTKREQAETMLEFCESRLSKAPSAPLTEHETALLRTFRPSL